MSAASVERARPIVLSPSKGETRATEYSKAATRGDWNSVWDNFDRRVEAKAANDPKDGEGSAVEASAKAGPDMFEAAE